MAGTAVLGRLTWLPVEAVEVVPETPRVKTLRLDVPDWPGHLPGQHVDVRLTAEDGYQAQRSYSIASPPGAAQLELTVERIEDGEVSPYLADELQPGDRFELRGPVGGYFVWEPCRGGPLLLVAGGSGVVPFRAMLRHLADTGRDVPTTLLVSSRSWDDVIYRAELEGLDGENIRIVHTLTREQPTTGTAMPGGSTPRCSPRSDPRHRIDRTSTFAARRRSSRLSRARSSSSATSPAAYAPNASDPLEDER